jgi:ABC-type multidrug transport system ATPase subunit
MTTRAGALRARDLELHTNRGPVYPPTSFDVDPGTVTALLGPARSGRTALLLTIAGRMRPTGGSATACGHDVVREAHRVRASVGMSVVAGVNDLDDPLTPAQHLAEISLLRGARRIDRAALLGRVSLTGLENRPVGRLDTEQCMRLGIALALAGEPPMIVIDDLDHDLELSQQTSVVATLREIANAGTTVVFTCVDPRTARLADAVVTLPVAEPLHGEVQPHAVA